MQYRGTTKDNTAAPIGIMEAPTRGNEVAPLQAMWGHHKSDFGSSYDGYKNQKSIIKLASVIISN